MLACSSLSCETHNVFLLTSSIVLFQLSLLEYDEDGTLDQTSIIPMVDGGTEGMDKKLF